MAIQNAATSKTLTVADPTPAYNSVLPLWRKSRAVLGGERFVKDLDTVCDTLTYTNLLIPFSPSMTQQQYDFYKAEAELPGIVAQYARIVVGGLLRKQPQLELPDYVDPSVKDWIMDEFTQDGNPLLAFLDKAIWEELQTSRAWVYVDFPVVPNPEQMTTQEIQALRPYPILWTAENVINWKMERSKVDGTMILSQVIVRTFEPNYEKNEFHPEQIETVKVHELDKSGAYQIRIFQNKSPASSMPMINGQVIQENIKKEGFELVETISNIMFNGERLNMIPAWPLNGSVQPYEPILTPLIDREISLYNKVSRRNHLLYGAATYTPVISADITDEQFQAIVDSGLGTWIHLPSNSQATVLETPTGALADMDRAIAQTVEDMAKLGIRMLSPETDQSGVALDIRNAAQTAQLGVLNTKVSNQMSDIITFMINWRYDAQIHSSEIKFTLSADFNPTPLGADWLRLATEWYQAGLIPRETWLYVLKHNDIIPADYDDSTAVQEINSDELIMPPTQYNMEKQAAMSMEQQAASIQMQAEADAQLQKQQSKSKEKK